MRTAALLLLVAACSPTAMPLAPDHPARPDAPAGRLAGPPPALRPGVASQPTPAQPEPPPAADPHEGHGGSP